jgi:hypothetical protein
MRADCFLEQYAGNLAGRAHPRIPHGRLTGVGAQPRDQLLEIVGRHRFASDDEERLRRDQADRFEVLHQVIPEGIDRTGGDVGAPFADSDRIAVRRRAGDTAFADGAAGARRILDHDGLAEHLAHALRHDARDHIGRAAYAVWHHHSDRTRRIALGHHSRRALQGYGTCRSEK